MGKRKMHLTNRRKAIRNDSMTELRHSNTQNMGL